MLKVIYREFNYLWYYSELQFKQIFPYYIIGVILGSLVSVFLKDKLFILFKKMSRNESSLISLVISCILGIVSPLCLYGTIPVAASFSKSGVKDDCLAAFMMGSILLNPQLIIYSAALGPLMLTVRVVTSFLCGLCAGLIIKFFFKSKKFFNFSSFDEPASRDTNPDMFLRFIYNIGRNLKATLKWFILGIILSALFQRYIPASLISTLFGNNKGFGVLMAATIGVPLYACGGGTIPILKDWLRQGMSYGSAAAFMITGPSTKITNLGALKIVLGIKHFIYYLIYISAFALISGMLINFIL